MRILYFFLLCLGALTLPNIWQSAKGADPHLFSKNHVHVKSDRYEISPEAASILSQPFFYWGKGSQFYVYFSLDQRYVLKIPRASKMREALLDRIFQRKLKKPDLFKSLRIAYDFFPKQTALMAIHVRSLTPSSIAGGLLLSVNGGLLDNLDVALYDRLHRRQIVNLLNIPFVLQKRQQLFSSALVQAKDSSASKQLLISYLDLLLYEKKQGWMSHDCAFWQNFGFENGHVFRLDIGSYVPIDDRFSWRRITKPVYHWLKTQDEKLATWFEQEIKVREQM